jgi:hypothetical protein
MRDLAMYIFEPLVLTGALLLAVSAFLFLAFVFAS